VLNAEVNAELKRAEPIAESMLNKKDAELEEDSKVRRSLQPSAFSIILAL
jgi:hypothetical protein